MRHFIAIAAFADYWRAVSIVLLLSVFGFLAILSADVFPSSIAVSARIGIVV